VAPPSFYREMVHRRIDQTVIQILLKKISLLQVIIYRFFFLFLFYLSGHCPMYVRYVETCVSLSCTQVSSGPSQSRREIYSSVATLLILNRTITTQKGKTIKASHPRNEGNRNKTKTQAWMTLNIPTRYSI
jgi:hypothetical protein